MSETAKDSTVGEGLRQALASHIEIEAERDDADLDVEAWSKRWCASVEAVSAARDLVHAANRLGKRVAEVYRLRPVEPDRECWVECDACGQEWPAEEINHEDLCPNCVAYEAEEIENADA